MPRSQTVDVDIVAEWSEVQRALYELEQIPVRGWAEGWPCAKQNEAIAWLLYGRAEAKKRLDRLKRVQRARARRHQVKMGRAR
jgi:hypothetical protein